MADDQRRGVQFARRAMDTLAELVGCPAEGITGIRRNDEGWIVEVEVLEVERRRITKVRVRLRQPQTAPES